MKITRAELVQRVATMHETWFLEEAAPPGGGRMYRLLRKQRGEPLSEWTTGWGMKMFLDGYEQGQKNLVEQEE